MVNTDLKKQKNKNKVVPYCRSHFKRWNFLLCSFIISQRVFLTSDCRRVCLPTTHLLVGYYTFWCWACTFFLGGANLLCYAAATAARLMTQVYDCVGFYCIPVQELRDVHIYRGRCYNCGKTLQKNTRQSRADLRLHHKISENESVFL